jgi:hypothetical protein
MSSGDKGERTADPAYEEFLGTAEAQAPFTWTDIREAVECGMVQGALYPAHSLEVRERASDAYAKLVLLYRFDEWKQARKGEGTWTDPHPVSFVAPL